MGKEKKPRSRPSKKKKKEVAEGVLALDEAEFENEEAALEAALAVPDPDAPAADSAEATAPKKPKRSRPRPKKKAPVPEGGVTEAGAASTGEAGDANLVRLMARLLWRPMTLMAIWFLTRLLKLNQESNPELQASQNPARAYYQALPRKSEDVIVVVMKIRNLL